MRSTLPALAVIAALGLAAPAAAKSARATYCSPTGDYCVSTTRQGGAVMLRFSTFSFSGSIRICVTDPQARRACKRFTLRQRSGMWQTSVRWHRHFPNGGKGLYRVRFFYGSGQLGPVLDFRLR